MDQKYSAETYVQVLRAYKKAVSRRSKHVYADVSKYVNKFRKGSNQPALSPRNIASICAYSMQIDNNLRKGKRPTKGIWKKSRDFRQEFPLRARARRSPKTRTVYAKYSPAKHRAAAPVKEEEEITIKSSGGKIKIVAPISQLRSLCNLLKAMIDA